MTLTDLIQGVACAIIFLGAFLDFTSPRGSEREHHANGLYTVGYTVLAVTNFAQHERWLGVFYAASAVIAAWYWWRRRRKRKRALQALGEKSRALIAAMVSRMREAARPWPVPRLAPGGAG